MQTAIRLSYQDIITAPVETTVIHRPRRRHSLFRMQYIIFKMAMYLLAMGCVMAALLVVAGVLFAVCGVDLFAHAVLPADAN